MRSSLRALHGRPARASTSANQPHPICCALTTVPGLRRPDKTPRTQSRTLGVLGRVLRGATRAQSDDARATTARVSSANASLQSRRRLSRVGARRRIGRYACRHKPPSLSRRSAQQADVMSRPSVPHAARWRSDRVVVRPTSTRSTLLPHTGAIQCARTHRAHAARADSVRAADHWMLESQPSV